MGTLKEYQCNGCGYTITGTRKGRTMGMMGEIETEKVPKKCPKCGELLVEHKVKGKTLECPNENCDYTE